jgi:CRP-like cAMP-binding protein/tRNA A-37 threonylcarbamoyl transferase component Bud32
MGLCISNAASSQSNSTTGAVNHEEKVLRAFKAKRANVYTSNNVNRDDGKIRSSYVQKHTCKTAEQTKIIMTALTQNYMFASLNESDLDLIALRMEIVTIAKGESIITQGKDGENFYIVSSGTFQVTVDTKQVSQVLEGGSFGELALLYDAPRQATVCAETDATLFSLDRDAYRFTIGMSSSSRTSEITAALHKVPLLSNLTDEQLMKVSDTVELFPYSEGDIIIAKGSEGKAFYMIKEGTVSVSDIGDQFSAHTLTEGDYFGERALITLEPRAATITATSPKVLLMALDVDSFNSLLGPIQDVLDHNMNMRVLTSVKLFSKLSDAERIKLSASFVLERFPEHTPVFTQGDRGHKFYIVKSGTARVVANELEVGSLKAGEFFGEMALLEDVARMATVTATSELECFALDRDGFMRILGSMHEMLEEETATRLKKLKKAAAADDGALSTETIELEEEVLIEFSDLKAIAVLGSGTFGRVSLVQHKQSKAVYALKAMHKSSVVKHKQQSNVINEKKVMVACKHPYVLRLYQTYKDEKKLYMLLEFIQGGELFSVLHHAKGDGIPDKSAQFYGAGIILAIAHLHSKNIAYRDMKPENCLIDKDGYPKLVDFGFAKVIVGKSFTLCGTPEYLAPELVLAKGHNKAVDYWAFGILVYEMIAGYSPFCDEDGYDIDVVCKNIVAGKLTFKSMFNKDVKDLVKSLLSKDVSTRLGNLKSGCDGIIEHKWFNSIDYPKYMRRTLKAPWKPKVKSATDTANFDPVEDEVDSDPNFEDRGDWDSEF